VTIASRPSFGTGRPGYASDLGQRKTEIFFAKDLDRANQLERKAKIAISAQPPFFANKAENLDAGLGNPARCERLVH
jgi:hypothetical protein